MASFVSTEGLARASARRPWLVVGLWVALLVAGVIFAAGIGKVLTTDSKIYEDIEAKQAADAVEHRLRGEEPAKEQVIVQSNALSVDDPQFQAYANGLVEQIRGAEGVASATTAYESGAQGLVSADRRTMLIPVVLTGELKDAGDTVKPLLKVLDGANGKDGFTVVTAGGGSVMNAWVTTSEKDLQTGESIGMPVALLVLVIVFGAVVAAGVPIVLALLSVVIAVGITAIIGRAFDMSFFVTNMITMMGLAVGIDYSLFIVERYREERRNGLAKLDAISRAGSTASKAVLLSGGTVVVALAGLLIVPDSIFRSLSAGAIVVVVVAVLAALTLLPAALSLLGDRVNKLRLPSLRRRKAETDAANGFWVRATGIVMRHPVSSVVSATALLAAAAVPYFTIQLGQSGVSTLPKDTAAYRGFAILDQQFNAGLLAPTDIVVEAKDVNAAEVQTGINRLVARLAQDPAFGAATVTPNSSGDLALIEVPVTGDAQSEATRATIERLRAEYIPTAFAGVGATVRVGGETAFTLDYTDLIGKYTPYVFAFVLGLSFVLLLVVFRSVVVPVKALLMNLLGVGAAYGLLVLVFQHGFLAGVFGFQQVEQIESWLPLFLFAILFGLSMDYHVFLLSRIRERFDQTGDNRGSVAFGVQNTARIITGAALIMVAVFAGFAMGESTSLQQMGFGLAVAVILDATIIRSVLVPASMVLLGNANWYLPSWLGWLPKVDVEGAHAHAPVAAEPAYAGD